MSKKENDARYHDQKRHGGKRQELIEKHGLKCSKCGKEGNAFEIVAHHKTWNPLDHSKQELLCRACHCREHHAIPKKLVTKTQIEEAIKNTKNLDDACKILGINRSSLYWKRKEFGLSFNAQYNEKKFTADQIEMAIKTFKTMQEAADYLGIDRTTLFDKRNKLK